MFGKVGAPPGNRNAAGHGRGGGKSKVSGVKKSAGVSKSTGPKRSSGVGSGIAALQRAGVTQQEHNAMMSFLSGRAPAPNLTRAKISAYQTTLTSDEGLRALGFK